MPKGDEYTWCEEIIFHGHMETDQRRFVGSITLEGERDSLIDKATELIDRALTKLIFASGRALRLNDIDYYLTPANIVNKTAVPNISRENGTIHRVTNSLIVKYNIGEERTKTLLSDIQSLEPRKKEALDKALGIYRVAKESSNYLQAIDTYFSCIQAIVREDTGLSDLSTGNLENALKDIVGNEKDFKQNFDKFWGKYRSGGSHGHLDLSHRPLVQDAKNDASQVDEWSRKSIEYYINKHKNTSC